jgi:protein-disulfide isomerase
MIRRWRQVLDLATSIAVIAASGAVLWALIIRPLVHGSESARPELPLPKDPLSIAGEATKGSYNAPVALIVYTDFQCPFCGAFARNVFPILEDRYVRTGRLLVAFRHLPLPMHPIAQKAAEAAECAGKQGHFWQMHDRLFALGGKLRADALVPAAEGLGLNGQQFRACLDNGESAGKIRDDVAGASRLTVQGTPTFFVGSLRADHRVAVYRRIGGAAALSVFAEAIDLLIRERH